MAIQKNLSVQSEDPSTGAENTVEILYQKMGDRWFAFSLIDDEVFVGSISQNEIEGGSVPTPNAERSVMKVHRKIGNS